MQVLWVIFRKTYGWQKKTDRIALSQFALATKLKKPAIVRALKRLIVKNIIIKKDNDMTNTYGFNKDFSQWKPLSKKITLSLLIPTKDTITKDINTLCPVKKKAKDTSSFTDIISYLNKTLGTDYKATTPKTQALIRVRFSEGATIEDFKTVIDRKASEWRGNPKMAKYLRPITLFGTKFESYLNEQDAKTDTREQLCKTCGMPDITGMFVDGDCRKCAEEKGQI